MNPSNREHTHCWHPNGRGITDGFARAGKHEGQCCQCGATYWRTWTVATRPLPGHGPHVTETVCVYDDEATHESE